MSNYKSTEITLGYGGGAYINVNGGKDEDCDWCWLLINSGNLSKSIQVPNILPYDMELDFTDDDLKGYGSTSIRNEIALGTGLIGFQGSINFAITETALKKLITHKFISRNNVFDISIFDGRSTLEVKCCYWTNFTISGSPRQVLTGSLSFVSTNNQYEDFCVFRDGELIKKPIYITKDGKENGTSEEVSVDPMKIKNNEKGAYQGFDEHLIEYWNTGSNGLESFNLSFTREAQPVYLNTPSRNPAYIRVGKINLSGSFSTWKDWLDTKHIYIADKKIMFYGFSSNENSSFSFNGIDDTGKYDYSIRLYNITGSSKFAWEIVNLRSESSDSSSGIDEELIDKNVINQNSNSTGETTNE